ncbi:MAG: TonB family protein [bacterium]|nr:TonB family protein [bacterium]
MKTSDVIFKWKRAEKRARILFILFSVIFHAFLVYYFYKAQYDIRIPETEKVIIEIRPITGEKIIFPSLKKKEEPLPVKLAKTLPKAPKVKPREQIPPPETVETPKQPEIPVKKWQPGKFPDALKIPVPPKESFKAPFKPDEYIKPENLAKVLRRIEIEEALEKAAAQNAQKENPPEDKENNIVIDTSARSYFQRRGFDITPWARKVVERINQHWFLPAGFNIVPDDTTADGTVGIAVTFEKNGRVAAAEIKRSSKIAHLDRSALNAVNLGSPFPALPDQLAAGQVKVFFLFNYESEL